jgi:hypothetical protein
MVNLDRVSLMDSSARLGRCEMSTFNSSDSLRARYLTRSEGAERERSTPQKTSYLL